MKKIVVLLTACLLLAAATVSAVAQATTYAVTSDLDYSKTDASTVTVPISEVLAGLGHWSVSQEEANYINYYFDGQKSFLYDKPTVDGYSYEYNGETGVLTVFVKRYKYVDSNGRDVTWLPKEAHIGDKTAVFELDPNKGSGPNKGKYYRADFHDVTWAALLTVSIEYGADFTLSAQTLNRYVNFAYDRAVLLDNELADYEAKHAAYMIEKQAYLQYQEALRQYNVDCSKYERYLDEMALYRDYLLQQEYLVAFRQYQEGLAAYEANQLAWKTYYEDLVKFGDYVEYRDNEYPILNAKYTDNKRRVDHQMYLLSLLEKEDPVTGVSFVEMILDDRIAQTIEEKRTWVEGLSAGAAEKIITSTHNLQRFFNEYRLLNTDQERFAYYRREYITYVKSLNDLYSGIEQLYKIDAVYNRLKEEYPDRITDMVRMLGSLYVQKCVFDDTVPLELNTVVDSRTGKRAYELVDASVRPAQDLPIANPRDVSGWPVAPKHPDSFEVTKEPTKPATLQKPTAPQRPIFESVSNADQLPGSMSQPTYVAKPVEPAKVNQPGQEPKLNWTDSVRALHQAYKAGKIVQREIFEGDQVVNLRFTSESQLIELDPNQRAYFVHFYNGDIYLGHSEPVLHGASASIPTEFANPTKPAEPGIEYEFAGWVDANGEKLDLSSITDVVYAYATFNRIELVYNVTWDVDGTKVTEKYKYGEMPEFGGSVEKASTAQYIYTFDGWDKERVPVTADVTYTAQYRETLQTYKVTFTMGDGEPQEKEYYYGEDLTQVVTTFGRPYINATAEHTYIFTGWKDKQGVFYADGEELPLLTENMAFEAMFTEVDNKYKITWIVDGVQTVQILKYGDMPAYGTTPIKASDERLNYVFADWDKEIVPVTEDATYTAQFTEQTRKYTVTFSVAGVEYVFDLEYGAVPKFEQLAQIQPVKPSDAKYQYEFVGWDPEPLIVYSDALYVATFVGIVRKYPVTFITDDKEITKEFEYGITPKYPDKMPTKATDSQYRYEFAGWSPKIVAVDGNPMTYVAQFTAIPLAPVEQGEPGKVTLDTEQSECRVELESGKVDLTQIVDMAGQANVSLQIKFGNASLSFEKNQVIAFYGMGNLASASLTSVTHAQGQAYRIQLSDPSGASVGTLMSQMTVVLPYSGTQAADVFLIGADGTLTLLRAQQTDGYLTFTTAEAGTFVIKQRYEVGKDVAENGTFEVVGQPCVGETMTVLPAPAQGFETDLVTVTCNGQAVEVNLANNAYTFVMPNGNVQVCVTFKAVQGVTPDSTEKETVAPDTEGETVPEGTEAETVPGGSQTEPETAPGQSEAPKQEPKSGCGGTIGAGVITALLIVAVGFVIGIVLRREREIRV